MFFMPGCHLDRPKNTEIGRKGKEQETDHKLSGGLAFYK